MSLYKGNFYVCSTACPVRLCMCACWYSCVYFQALLLDSLYVNLCLDHFMVSLYFVDRMFIVCIHMSNLVSVRLCVLTCMWKQWGLIYPRGVLSEGCAVSAARLSSPHTSCSVAFLPMAFMGRSWAANEQPWHHNDETMTWNKVCVTVGAATVREAGPWCYC